MEYFGVGSGLDDFGEVLTVGVGDKDLSELLALHHAYNPFDAFAIETVENVV